MIKNLVFSGGGLKGYAFIGVIKALYETHIIENITKFVGTSIGSIAAYFSIIGITHNEINDFIAKGGVCICYSIALGLWIWYFILIIEGKIFGKDGCRYCTLAKDLLEYKKIASDNIQYIKIISI